MAIVSIGSFTRDGHLRPGRRVIMRMALASGGVALSGCGKDRLPTYSPGPIQPRSIARDGMAIVTAFVLSDVNEQDKYFATNLTSKGIIPVYLQITNTSNNANLLFDRDQVRVTRGGDVLSTSDRAKKPVDETAAVIVSSALIVSIVLVSALTVILGPLASKMVSDISVIKRNIVEKEFYSRTLLPGEKADGFIYLTAKDARTLIDGYELVVILKPISQTGGMRESSYSIKL